MRSKVVERETPHRWYLRPDPLQHDEERFLDWLSFLPEHGGTRHQRQYMLKSAKGMLRARINAPRAARNGETLSSTSVRQWFLHLRAICHWMFERQAWRYSSLTPNDYLAFLASRPPRSGGTMAIETLNRWRATFQTMWDLRHLYVAALTFNPAVLALQAEAAQPTRARQPWKALGEATAIPLIRDAAKWLDSYSDFVVDCVDSTWHVGRKVGMSDYQRSQLRKQHFAKLDEHPMMQALREAIGTKEHAFNVLTSAITITEGACMTLMLFLVGFRASEMTALSCKCIEPSDEVKEESGFHIRGIAAKKGGQTRSWIAPGEVARAIGVLQRLHHHARNAAKQKALFVDRQSRVPVADGTRKKGRKLRPASANVRIRKFARAAFRSESPQIKRLHCHVARKTFARFVVLRDKRGLESLANHFGHTHRAITDGYYVGIDIELAQMVDEEGRKDLAEGLTELLTARHIAGKAGRALSKVREQVLGSKSTFKGKNSVRSVVERLIRDGVQLAPCDWGYCVYTQALSACNGSRSGPNHVNRTPDVCATCANFAVTERHITWWDQRLQREREFVARPDLPAQVKDFAERRYRNSERIMSSLTEQVADGKGRRLKHAKQRKPA